ncbi:NAD(P)/FAD-dependent oxidoreductase [Magnetospirillum sp. SS-4]|uniref:NAD(P)/FAD-dependent oxidoreductase n=1 Tax=Magnetospirillum sp. SS-4 TaxID=2681465 RepID=UPI00138555CC|nr:NAD(P)/FAD-dependent oxidoreductase [Magnetospirillum sp. SS-4]CAA7620428.1 Ferredoxin--NADP reductase [Magnetospirillum sp. SS-4]
MTVHETDAVVVGAGPVGLFAVFQCGMVKVRCHVVDALEAVGGQLSALYPEKPIYDIPGHPSILAAELVDRLAEQAAPFAPIYHFGVQVESLSRESDGRWRCGLSDGSAILARAVIIAAGAGAFGPNRPPLDGLERFEGTGVFYLVRRREDFRDKRVVIAGGGDSAVDWAISLSEIAARVMVVHRRPKFRAAPENEARLKQLAETGAVELVVPYQLHGLEGEAGRLSAVTVADLDGNVRRLDADVLLPFYGLSTDLGPIAGWGLAMDRNVIAVDPATGATSAPAIFAAGDICAYPGKLKLILSGFAEAARVAHSAYEVVHPGEALHFEHSTTSGVPARPL